MSKLILNQINAIKPLLKVKGLDFEKYALIKDGILYFNNGEIQIELKIDIPFDCCINVFQLLSILSSIKGESVIVNKDGKVYIHFEDISYTVDTLPLDSLNNVLKNYDETQLVECDKPYVFLKMCSLAEHYLTPINNSANPNYLSETLNIVNNNVCLTDRNNAYQAVLDFAMPNLAFSLNTLIPFNKISKKVDIVGMGLNGNTLVLLFSNNMKVYLPSIHNINPELQVRHYENLTKVMEREWKIDNSIIIPESVKTQVNIVNKISLHNIVHITSSFCQSDDIQIHYPEFADNNFVFKCVYKHLKLALENGYQFAICKHGLALLSDDYRIRGVIAKLLSDDPRG